MYTVEIERKAAKALKKMDRTTAERIDAVIRYLADDPRPRQAKALTGPLSGYYRIAITGPGGEYRILYTVDDKAGQVIIIDAGPREGMY